MPASLSALREYKHLEGRRIGSGLTIEELERWMRLKIELDQMSGGQRDRRKSFRLPTRLRCSFDEGEAQRRTVVSDLSDGGAFIQTNAPLPLDSRIELTLDLDEDGPLELSAIVVTSQVGLDLDLERLGMGVRFVDLDGEKRGRICKLYEHLSRTEPAMENQTAA